MTERHVTVRLAMTARRYVTGATEAERMNKRLTASAREMADAHRKAGDEMDRTAARSERAGRRTGRGMLYAAAGVAALGAAGGGLKLLPGTITALGTAGGALPPMFLGAAATAGVLVTSLKGVGKAAGEILKSDDPFAGLGKNARQLVYEVKALQPAMSGVRQGFQDRTLAGADRNLRAMATVTIPAVRGGLNNLADDWARAFREITLAVTDPHFTGAFNTATRGADWFFDLVNTRIQPTIRSLSTLAQSADPLARAFGQGLINAIDRFNAKIESAARSGSLDEFFRDGAEGAGAFLDLAQEVARITGQVIAAVAKQGGTLRDSSSALAAYIDSGRSASDVAGIVDTLTAAYEGMRDVLGPLGGIARDALADPGTADALRTMFDVLAAGSAVLRVIFDLFQMLPDGMQSTVLAAVALALIAKRLSTALLLVQGGATRAATALTATGAAGARAGRGLTAAAAGAGKAGAALLALQLAGVVLDQFDGAAADMDALGRAIEDFTTKGKVSGELTRLFGNNLEDMGQAARGASDSWFPKLGRSIESILPPAKSLNEVIFGGSFTGDVERFKALDAALLQYAQTTKDTKGAQELWNQAFNQSGLDMVEFAKLLPSSTAELGRMQEAAHAGASGMQANSERAKALAGSFEEAARSGKDLAATMDLINGKNISAVEGQIALEAAYDEAKETIDEYGRVTKKGTHEINLGTEAGRASMEALIGISTAATQAADAEVKRTNNTAAGVPILNAARERFIALATVMTGSKKAAETLANEILGIPDADIKVKSDADKVIEKFKALGITIKRTPDGKLVVVKADTAAAKRHLAEAKRAIDALNSKTVTLTVHRVFTGPRGDQRVTGPGGSGTLTRDAKGGVHIPRQRGGVRAAAGGLLRPEIYPASDPPLYQFAERQTGGELFLPRRGIDRDRGRALLAVGASWYGGMFVPMRGGGVRVTGVRAAAAGLVNVAPATGGTDRGAARLDYVESYIRAKDAIAGVSRALKENGRSLSTATAKGRENLSAVHQAIRAAQDAARAKYEETGSVKAANAVYEAHIAALRRTMAARGASASSIRSALSVASRPTFAGAAPANSSSQIAYARAQISAAGGVGELADKLSLNRAGVDIGTEHGRDNLSAVLDFLEVAERVAQARFAVSPNAKAATAVYNQYLDRLRQTLRAAGYSAAMINSLINTYGKITLQRNDRGGVYMALGGVGAPLADAKIAAGGRTMYGWAEKQTGGELFLPRLGERARGERLLAVGAGWYGGRFVPGGAGGTGGTTINNNLTVNGRLDPLTLPQLAGFMRQMDAEARVGRRK
jgi:hypothetical protein